MATSRQIAVPTGATATKIAAPAASDNQQGDTFVLTNTGTVPLYIGGSDVTTSNGWRGLTVGATIVLDVNESLYAVVSGATAGAVDILRVK